MLLKAGIVPSITKWEDPLGKGIKTITHFHDGSNLKVNVRVPLESREMIIAALYLVTSSPLSISLPVKTSRFLLRS